MPLSLLNLIPCTFHMRLVVGPLNQNLEAKHILAFEFLILTITEGDKIIYDLPWSLCSRQFVLSFESRVYKTPFPWCCNLCCFTSSSILLRLPSLVKDWFSLDCFKSGNSEALSKIVLLRNILSLRISNSWSPCYLEFWILWFRDYISLWLKDLPILSGWKLLHANLFHSTAITNFLFFLDFLFSLNSYNV